MCVDYFIRHEELSSGVRYVCSHLGIPFDEKDIPCLKVSSRNRDLSIADYYDRACISAVEKYFEFELSYFKYSINDGDFKWS